MFAKVGDAMIWQENAVKLLGIIIDAGVKFNKNVKVICKKASQKLNAILRMANILTEYKRKLQSCNCNVFVSQFNYFPLIWIFLTNL